MDRKILIVALTLASFIAWLFFDFPFLFLFFPFGLFRSNKGNTKNHQAHFCPNCGMIQHPSYKFCPNCSMPQVEQLRYTNSVESEYK